MNPYLVDDGSLRPEDLVPLRVGDLWIVPEAAGFEAPHVEGEAIFIRAQDVFGTGNHPTTRLCLERLHALSPFSRVLDAGVGSGVLSLAALSWGSERALGVDVSQHALTAARANAERNGLGDRLELTDRPLAELSGAFDAVCANIRGPELIQLAPALVRRLDTRGVLLLSGVRGGEAADVLRAYRTLGLRFVGEHELEGWVMLEMLAAW